MPSKEMPPITEMEKTYLASVLDESDIPSPAIRAEIEEMFRGVDVQSPEMEKIVGKMIEIQRERFHDQRKVFQELNSAVRNKEYIRERIKAEIGQGNLNILRLSIDVEGLKTVNDIAGHEKGDEYLKEIYLTIEKTIEEIKLALPKEVRNELEFVVTAEGGDEFGVLVIGKKEKEGFQLSRDSLSFKKGAFEFHRKGESDIESRIKKEGPEGDGHWEKKMVDKGEVIGNFISNYINGNLEKLDTEQIISKKRILDRFLKYQERFTQSYLKSIETIEDQEVLRNILERHQSRIEAYSEALSVKDKADFDKKSEKEKLLIFIKNQGEGKIDELKRRFRNYKFFASASCGSAVLEEILTERQLRVKKKYPDSLKDVATQNSYLGEFLTAADKNMNREKSTFKETAREIGRTEKKLKGLRTHMLVLSRTNEQVELLFQHEMLLEENEGLLSQVEKLSGKVYELTTALTKCETDLAAAKG